MMTSLLKRFLFLICLSWSLPSQAALTEAQVKEIIANSLIQLFAGSLAQAYADSAKYNLSTQELLERQKLEQLEAQLKEDVEELNQEIARFRKANALPLGKPIKNSELAAMNQEMFRE